MTTMLVIASTMCAIDTATLGLDGNHSFTLASILCLLIFLFFFFYARFIDRLGEELDEPAQTVLIHYVNLVKFAH